MIFHDFDIVLLLKWLATPFCCGLRKNWNFNCFFLFVITPRDVHMHKIFCYVIVSLGKKNIYEVSMQASECLYGNTCINFW